MNAARINGRKPPTPPAIIVDERDDLDRKALPFALWFAVLVALETARDANISTSEVAGRVSRATLGHTGRHLGAITAQLERLERDGLVEENTRDDDPRAPRMWRVTTAGRLAADEATSLLTSLITRRAKGVPQQKGA